MDTGSVSWLNYFFYKKSALKSQHWVVVNQNIDSIYIRVIENRKNYDNEVRIFRCVKKAKSLFGAKIQSTYAHMWLNINLSTSTY